MKKNVFLFFLLASLFACGNNTNTPVSNSLTSQFSSTTSSDSLDKMSFGEQIEYNRENQIENNFISNLINTQICINNNKIVPYTGDKNIVDGQVFAEFGILRSFTTDGKYFYALVNANMNFSYGYNIGIIVKIDLSGMVVKYSNNTYYWGKEVKISFFDDNLIVHNTIDGEVPYSGLAKSFIGKTIKFDRELNLIDEDYVHNTFFGNLVGGYTTNLFSISNDGTKVFVVYRCEINDQFYSVIYTYEKENSDFKLTNTLNINSSTYQSVYSTNDYIIINTYESSQITDGAITSIMVLDWDLHLIGTIYTNNGLYHTDEERYYSYTYNEYRTDAYVYQQSKPYGCVEIDGCLYMMKGCWGTGSPRGVYLYKIISSN